MTLESLARSAVAASVVVGDTLVFAPAAIAAGALLGPTDALVSRFYREYARIALLGFGAHVRTTGDDHLDPKARYVFVSNHQSDLDPLVILLSLERHPLRFVAKRELADVPLFGQALRLTGNVFVDRHDTGRDVAALDGAQAELVRDVSVHFFAEGTRTEDGEVGPFKKGAAMFAIKSGLPLVPIGVYGAFEILPRGVIVNGGGPIGVALGEPIESTRFSMDDRDKLTDTLREAVLVQFARALALARTG